MLVYVLILLCSIALLSVSAWKFSVTIKVKSKFNGIINDLENNIDINTEKQITRDNDGYPVLRHGDKISQDLKRVALNTLKKAINKEYPNTTDTLNSSSGEGTSWINSQKNIWMSLLLLSLIGFIISLILIIKNTLKLQKKGKMKK